MELQEHILRHKLERNKHWHPYRTRCCLPGQPVSLSWTPGTGCQLRHQRTSGWNCSRQALLDRHLSKTRMPGTNGYVIIVSLSLVRLIHPSMRHGPVTLMINLTNCCFEETHPVDVNSWFVGPPCPPLVHPMWLSFEAQPGVYRLCFILFNIDMISFDVSIYLNLKCQHLTQCTRTCQVSSHWQLPPNNHNNVTCHDNLQNHQNPSSSHD